MLIKWEKNKIKTILPGTNLMTTLFETLFLSNETRHKDNCVVFYSLNFFNRTRHTVWIVLNGISLMAC